MKTREHFWNRVDRTNPDGCWPFMGARKRGRTLPYGELGWQHRRWLAHRLAWFLTNGEIPTGMKVLHHCDNAPCCNPVHLFLGTQADNVLDMHAKGRHAVNVTRTVLSESQVRDIRARTAAGGVTRAALAREFGCTGSCISSVVLRQTWRHVI